MKMAIVDEPASLCLLLCLCVSEPGPRERRERHAEDAIDKGQTTNPKEKQGTRCTLNSIYTLC